MAKQTGIIKLKGEIGGISFYKTSEGHLAREKGGVDAKRLASDPAFQRTRENGQEFGRAGKGGKLIRRAIRYLLKNAKDKRVASRLIKNLMSILKTDVTNPRGERRIEDGNMDLLNFFEFNGRTELSNALASSFATQIDRATGEVTFSLDAFTPWEHIDAPEGTTDFKINVGAAEIDFENETSVFARDETSIIEYDKVENSATDFTINLSAGSQLPILAILGIEFYQEVNGEMYLLKNGAFNALAVVKVDQA